MRVLMLGWEFPPFLAGGLGTACFGLTRALRKQGHDVLFVLPKAIGEAQAEHVRLVGADGVRAMLTAEQERDTAFRPGRPQALVPAEAARKVAAEERERLLQEVAQKDAPGSFRSIEIPAGFSSPYGGLEGAGSVEAQRLGTLVHELYDLAHERRGANPIDPADTAGPEAAGRPDVAPAEPLGGVAAVTADDLGPALDAIAELSRDSGQYGKDLMGDAARYARMIAALARRLQFDVVHAHDWLAYPAGLAVKAVTGKPLVCHMHATEFDRSGDNINQAVYDIERAGINGADRAVAVSQLTKAILVNRYGADTDRVDVVYNGVDAESAQPAEGAKIGSDDKIVLFLGRITMQKGPEYFVRAAKRVLEKVPEAKFVVAGSGDMATRMIEEAAHLGIGHKVLFTGFLRGRDVDRVFRLADCYVMPSVSEPFGIAALEAMQRDVPTIISRQSGVSEVLTHALKVDFWDTDEMANKIVAVLRHPPLSQTLREHAPFELRRLTWMQSASKVVESYRRAMYTSI